MTGAELKAARLKLGLTLEQMARALGYRGEHVINSQWRIENLNAGIGLISNNKASLVDALLYGWRPPDWPKGWK